MGFLKRLTARLGSRTSDENAEDGLSVTAELNHLLMPLDRAARYEDPLERMLADHDLGAVVGGGTMQLPSGEIEFVDVQVQLTDGARGIPLLLEKIEELGAPKGSVLRIFDSDPPRRISFGTVERVGVYLDGVTLPDEVYASSDVNVVIEELNKRLGGRGEMHSYWEGPRETALYFYGDSAEEMKASMTDFLAIYSLCSGARVATIAPRPT